MTKQEARAAGSENSEKREKSFAFCLDMLNDMLSATLLEYYY